MLFEDGYGYAGTGELCDWTEFGGVTNADTFCRAAAMRLNLISIID